MTRSTKRVPKVSERHKDYQAEIDALLPALNRRSKGLCERCAEVPHMGRPHHRQRRSQGGKNTMHNLVMVCSACHDWIHSHPALSFEQGWLRLGKPRPSSRKTPKLKS